MGSEMCIRDRRESYFWPGMRRDIADWYRQCPQCAMSKGSPLRPHGKLQNISVGAPMDLVTIDILSGLPVASDGSKYLLVAVDAFTKWIEAYPLPDQEAHTCMTALYNGFFSRFSLPRPLQRIRAETSNLLLCKNCVALQVFVKRVQPHFTLGLMVLPSGQTVQFYRCCAQLPVNIRRNGRRKSLLCLPLTA